MKTLVITITVETEVADDTSQTDIDNYVSTTTSRVEAAMPGTVVEVSDWDLEDYSG